MTLKLGTCSLLGCLALAGSLGWTLLAPGPETRELGRESQSLGAELSRARDAQASLEKDLESCQQRLDSTRRDESAAETEVQGVLVSDPRLAVGGDSILDEIKDRIANLETEIDAANRSLPTDSPPTLPTEPARQANTPERNVHRSETTPIDQRLEPLRASISLLVSSGRQLATGLVVGSQADKVYLLTVAAAVPPGAEVICLLRSSGKAEEFQPIPCEVVYREEGSPFVLLEGTFTKSTEFAVLMESGFASREPSKGAAVYAVGAHAVGMSAFTGSVFEGIVSSLDDAPNEGPRLLRTTLPVNEGSQGSVVVGADGKVIGILWRGDGELVRVSAVLPAAAATPVLERLRKQALATIGGAKTRGTDRPSDGSRPEDSVDLPKPLSLEAEMFGGPDDLVLVWDRTAGTLMAFRSGSASPLWEISGASTLAYRPWQLHGFLSHEKSRITVVLNLRSGKPGSRLSASLSSCFSRAWATFPFGKTHVLALPQGLAMANLESGRIFEVRGLKATLMTHVEDLLTLSTEQGDVGWLTRGEFLTIFTRIDALQLEIEELGRDRMMAEDARHTEVRRRESQIQVLSQQLGRGVKVFSVPGGLGRDATRPGTSFCHAPGTYVHLIGRNAWQIGPDQVARLGRLEPLWHSAARDTGMDPAGTPGWAMASPDGRYAVTATHLYDLKDLKAVAELPFPAGFAGFTSRSKKIYAYDRNSQRLVFLSLEDVLRGNGDVIKTRG